MLLWFIVLVAPAVLATPTGLILHSSLHLSLSTNNDAGNLFHNHIHHHHHHHHNECFKGRQNK